MAGNGEQIIFAFWVLFTPFRKLYSVKIQTVLFPIRFARTTFLTFVTEIFT